MQLCRIIYYSLAALHVLSDIFAHHQEHLHCLMASGITHICCCQLVSWACWNLVPTCPSYQLAATYVCNSRSCNTVKMLLMMSENIAQNMQSSQRIINYSTQLHLVGHFCILYYFKHFHFLALSIPSDPVTQQHICTLMGEKE